MNVGLINVSSTFSSKNKFKIPNFVYVLSFSKGIPNSFAFSIASSSLEIESKSNPVASFTASFIVTLLQGLAKLIVLSSYSISYFPCNSKVKLEIKSSVKSIISLKSAYAWYNSIIVNSGLCFTEIPSFLKLLLISNTFSNPPTNNLFKYNSGAILKNNSISNALWCVTNGLAVAPPAIGCIIGVSTSVNPFFSK